MDETSVKSKSFLMPILMLVIVSIISVAAINTYLNISVFKKHLSHDLEQYKKEYLEKNKNDVFNKVHIVDNSIRFQIAQIETNLKKSLKERVATALNISEDIYSRYKGKISDEEIKLKIITHLSVIQFNNGRGFYFISDYKTNKVLSHKIKKFIGKDMTNFKDIRGKRLIPLRNKAVENGEIGFFKVYFNKPNDIKNEYPKLNAAVLFKPYNLVIGTGEYLDVIEKQTKKYVLERFSNFQKDKSKYLFFLDLHNINGGNSFATMILNPNRPDLIGKKINDSFKDAKGKEFRKEFLKGLREKGESFTKYWYKKPNANTPYPKMSYFYLQKDWNWVIASGFYYDDLEQHIAKVENEVKKYTSNVIYNTLIIVFILALVVLILAILVSLRIDKTIKNYTDELVKNRFELELAQKVAKLGSWKLDLVTNELSWSKETYHIFEINEDQFKSTYDDFLNLIHIEDKEKVDEAYNQSLKDKQPYYIVHRISMKDGRVKWVEEKCETVFDKDGIPLLSNGTIQDITKEYEQQLYQQSQEKLLFEQSKMASMGEMIGNIAHQWRQPLSIISTAATGMQMRKQLGTLSDEGLNQTCEYINESTQYLSKTIDTFRNFIRGENKQEKIRICNLLDESISLIKDTLKNNHIQLNNTIHCDNDCGRRVLISQNEFTQVVINIINNSKDIILERKIKDGYVQLNHSFAGNNVVITIEDNGGGIPEDILPRVFEPYFTTKHQSQGTGLGLYMSYKIIVESFKGKLYAANTNLGVKFFIEIPLA
jgi:signal transduction histidine kinase